MIIECKIPTVQFINKREPLVNEQTGKFDDVTLVFTPNDKNQGHVIQFKNINDFENVCIEKYD